MKFLPAVVAVCYPLLIFAGLHYFEPRVVALLVGGGVLLRALARWRRPSPEQLRQLLLPGLVVVAVVASTLLLNDPRFLLFVPVLMNLGLLLAFGRTLHTGPPLVETFARMRHSDFTPAEIRHCRRVTVVWCFFFAANAAVVLWLALASDLWLWTVYTGFVSYLLIGLLLLGEFIVRSWRFQRYQGSIVEPLFSRIFPRGPAA